MIIKDTNSGGDGFYNENQIVKVEPLEFREGEWRSCIFTTCPTATFEMFWATEEEAKREHSKLISKLDQHTRKPKWWQFWRK